MSSSSALRRISLASWPRRFPVAQFPNAPLLVAIAAALASRLLSGAAHDVARAVFYLALGVWAYEELVRGVNWFRRLLGGGFLIYLVASLARALGA